jgi:hypothetical protein
VRECHQENKESRANTGMSALNLLAFVQAFATFAALAVWILF